MEMGLKVLFVIVSILVVVLVMLAMFTGGAANIGETMDDWSGSVPENPQPCGNYNGKVVSQCNIFAGCQCCKTAGTGTATTCADCKSAGEKCV